jgi:hypothetical protein
MGGACKMGEEFLSISQKLVNFSNGGQIALQSRLNGDKELSKMQSGRCRIIEWPHRRTTLPE